MGRAYLNLRFTRLRQNVAVGCVIIAAAGFLQVRSVRTAEARVQTTSPVPGFADSLALITNLLDRGRGIEAENVARALLGRMESLRGPDSIEVAEVLDLLWRAVRRSSKVDQQEKKAIVERAVTIKERLLSPTHPSLATSLLNLGVQRALAGDPAAAKPSVERALAIREATLGPDHFAVAGVLQNLGGLLITLRDDDGAKVVLERAQRIREKVYGEQNPDAIRTLVNLAILYQETGDYVTARQRYARALALCEKLLDSTDPLTLHVLAGVAVVLSELGGDYVGSARLNERLMALTERAFGATDMRLRTPLEHLAMDLRDLGHYDAAKTLAERSLAIAERAYGTNHVEVAGSLHTLATILTQLGDYGEAMRLFERATRISEEVLRPSDPESARASWFIPHLFPLSGYAPDDMDLFERVLAIREQQAGLADPRAAESFSNLAAALTTVEDFKRMRPLFERALASQEMFLGPDHPEVAASATNLAYVFSRSGELTLAQALYQRALTIWEQSLGTTHPKVATALVNLGRLHMDAGRRDEAAALLGRAQAIQEASLPAEHPDVARTLTTRAELAARSGDANDAFALASRAETISREHVRLTVRTLPERQALAYASSYPASLDLLLSLASAHSRDKPMVMAAWDAAIRARGIVLDDVAVRHRSVRAGKGEQVAGLAKALTETRTRLAALIVRGIRNEAPEHYRRLLDQARAEKDRAERALAESSAEARDAELGRPVSLIDVSGARPSDTALVGFVKYQSDGVEASDVRTREQDSQTAYAAFVLDITREITLVPLGPAREIDALVVKWRKRLEQEAMAAGRVSTRAETAYRQEAELLRRSVWDPLVPHVANARRVFIVPDGALHVVSFAALPTGASEYLAETGPVIHYLSAERDLVRTDRSPSDRRGLLALGGAAFDEADLDSVSRASFRGSRSACGDFQSVRFDPLPASLKEVDEVVMLWKQAHDGSPEITPLTGAAATEAAFKAGAAGRRVLHLATHGFFLGGQCASATDRGPASTVAGPSMRVVKENPLLLSGLILAGANRRNAVPPDREDGVLTAEEVASLDLRGVEWAVLSGCDTGRGEARAGEGVFGLRRAFQVAGARTVIMSLWAVEDQATRLWMHNLYEARLNKKANTADAVRSASVALLRQRRAKGLGGHPFYWGAFVAAGEWQ